MLSIKNHLKVTTNFQCPVHSLQEKRFPENQYYRRKAYTPKVCLLGVSTHQISTTPNRGNPNPKEIIGFRDFSLNLTTAKISNKPGMSPVDFLRAFFLPRLSSTHTHRKPRLNVIFIYLFYFNFIIHVTRGQGRYIQRDGKLLIFLLTSGLEHGPWRHAAANK